MIDTSSVLVVYCNATCRAPREESLRIQQTGIEELEPVPPAKIAILLHIPAAFKLPDRDAPHLTPGFERRIVIIVDTKI